MGLENIEAILGGSKTLKMHLKSEMDLIELSKKGVSKEALLNLVDYLNTTIHQARSWLPVSERTVQRYSVEHRFKKHGSEHILQIAKVAAKGSEVFEDKDKFLLWLNFPNQALGNKSPVSLLDSAFGTNIILEELGRIEHGIFA